jgi:hypothetical protein
MGIAALNPSYALLGMAKTALYDAVREHKGSGAPRSLLGSRWAPAQVSRVLDLCQF